MVLGSWYVTYYVLQICVLSFFPFSNWYLYDMLCNEGEGCGVLRLAWVGHWHARTPGFLVTTNFFVKSNYFLLVDVAAHVHCCRLHWRKHQAVWEWREIFRQDWDQGHARDLQEEQEDNRHGRRWVRSSIENEWPIIVEDAFTRLERPRWCRHTARWPTFRCGTKFYRTSNCSRF